MKHLNLAILTLVITFSVSCQSPGPPTSANLKQTEPQQSEKLFPVAVLVRTTRARLYQKSSASSRLVKQVSQGDLLTLGAEPDGPWYQVQLAKKGQYAWVHKDEISLLYSKEAKTSTTNIAKPRKAESSSPKGSEAGGRSYINVDGERVKSPVRSESRPAGASARCNDGTYSFSANRRGTCSHHGGVAEWY